MGARVPEITRITTSVNNTEQKKRTTPVEGAPLPWRPGFIHWGPEERRVVLREMIRLAEKFPKQDTMWWCLEAMKVLPPHRRRSERSMRLGRKTVKVFEGLAAVFEECFDPQNGEPVEEPVGEKDPTTH